MFRIQVMLVFFLCALNTQEWITSALQSYYYYFVIYFLPFLETFHFPSATNESLGYLVNQSIAQQQQVQECLDFFDGRIFF